MKLDELMIDLDRDFLLEMAMRVKPANSGLRQVIWVSTKDHAKGRHGPRLKVSNVVGKFDESDNFSVTLAKEPIIVAGKSKFSTSENEDILDWVKINHEPLMKHWEDVYEDDAQFYAELEKV